MPDRGQAYQLTFPGGQLPAVGDSETNPEYVQRVTTLAYQLAGGPALIMSLQQAQQTVEDSGLEGAREWLRPRFARERTAAELAAEPRKLTPRTALQRLARETRGISALQFRILAVLADRVGIDGRGESWPSRALLAEQCECDVSTLKRNLRKLESGGYLKRRFRIEAGGQRSTVYVLFPDVGVVGNSVDKWPDRGGASAPPGGRQRAPRLKKD